MIPGPPYDFKCMKCGNVFLVSRLGVFNSPPIIVRCPKCGSLKTKHLGMLVK